MKKYLFFGIAILGIALGSLGAVNPAHAYVYNTDGNGWSQGNGS